MHRGSGLRTLRLGCNLGEGGGGRVTAVVVLDGREQPPHIAGVQAGVCHPGPTEQGLRQTAGRNRSAEGKVVRLVSWGIKNGH